MSQKKSQTSVWSFVDVGSELQKKLADIDTDSMKPTDRVKIRIPMFREGLFTHPWYGRLDFNLSYLQKLKDNHDKKVLGRALPIDEDHRQFSGKAIGWIESEGKIDLEAAMVLGPERLQEEKHVLYGEIELTRRGARLVKEGEYRYFSAEIKNDFHTRELVVGENGQEQLVKFGPVLVGGALTNVPFIPGLGEYQYSEGVTTCKTDDGDTIILNSEFDDELGYQFGVFGFKYEDDKNQSDEVQDEGDAEAEQESPEPEQYTNTGDGRMEKLLAQLATLNSASEKADFLRGESQNYTEAADASFITLMLSSLDDTIKSEAKAAEAVRRATQKENENIQLKAQAVELELKAERATELAFNDKVNLVVQERLAEGHYPAVVNKMKAILLASPVEARGATFRLSEEDEKPVDLMKVCNELLACLPKEARMNFSEDLSSNSATSEAGADDTEVVPTDADDTAQFSEEESDENEVPENVQKFADFWGSMPEKDLWPRIDEDGRGFKPAAL